MLRKKWLFIASAIAILFASLLATLLIQRQQLRSRAVIEEPQKSHALTCKELGGRAITPFTSCPSGTNRLSNTTLDPLFYCCK